MFASSVCHYFSFQTKSKPKPAKSSQERDPTPPKQPTAEDSSSTNHRSSLKKQQQHHQQQQDRSKEASPETTMPKTAPKVTPDAAPGYLPKRQDSEQLATSSAELKALLAIGQDHNRQQRAVPSPVSLGDLPPVPPEALEASSAQLLEMQEELEKAAKSEESMKDTSLDANFDHLEKATESWVDTITAEVKKSVCCRSRFEPFFCIETVSLIHDLHWNFSEWGQLCILKVGCIFPVIRILTFNIGFSK